MSRPSTVVVAIVAFVLGLTVMSLMPSSASRPAPSPEAMQTSPLEWSLTGTDFTVRNMSDESFIIVGYSARGVPRLPFMSERGEMTLPSTDVTNFVVYPVAVMDGIQRVNVADSIAAEALVSDNCIPAICPRPPGCRRFCPPGEPYRFLAELDLPIIEGR